jgi:hypothetical protein
MTRSSHERPAGVLATLFFALGLALAFSLSASSLAQEEDEGEDPGLPVPGEEEEPEDNGDGFDDDGFEEDAETDVFADEEAQVDAPVGGAEAGFGGLAEDGSGLLSVLFIGSMATIAGTAGLTWYRKAFAS